MLCNALPLQLLSLTKKRLSFAVSPKPMSPTDLPFPYTVTPVHTNELCDTLVGGIVCLVGAPIREHQDVIETIKRTEH
jgi:hypothetical protein